MIQLFGLARVGRDVEVRRTTNDQAVASVSLAFNYGRKDADGKKPTQWLDGALWGKHAEVLAPYLTKGTLVAVTLEDVHIETFRKQDNTEGVKLTGRIAAIDLAGGGQQAAPQQQAQQPAQRQATQQQRPAARQQQASTGTGFDDMPDDIPF